MFMCEHSWCLYWNYSELCTRMQRYLKYTGAHHFWMIRQVARKFPWIECEKAFEAWNISSGKNVEEAKHFYPEFMLGLLPPRQTLAWRYYCNNIYLWAIRARQKWAEDKKTKVLEWFRRPLKLFERERMSYWRGSWKRMRRVINFVKFIHRFDLCCTSTAPSTCTENYVGNWEVEQSKNEQCICFESRSSTSSSDFSCQLFIAFERYKTALSENGC